jgi:esterase/lipase superfamily enzyme
MPKFWMISNRAVKNGRPSGSRGGLAYYVADKTPLDHFANWQKVTPASFRKLLAGAADAFPAIGHDENDRQRHVTFFIHGYNNDWQDAARRYERVSRDLFGGRNSLGLCISFDWPSLGSVLGYLPDRDHARECAADLADVLSQLYDWLLDKQAAAAVDPMKGCRAKVSVIAHSMGNYLTQKAMAAVWTRKNQPLLVSLVNQLLMVAADVDNDLFNAGSDDATDGTATANLTYRVTALYSGRDTVLGASSGLKHFGTRRLGRSGLATRPPPGKDNVWDIDCSSFFPASVGGMDIHSAFFDTAATQRLMRELLRGSDRAVLDSLGLIAGTAWP